MAEHRPAPAGPARRRDPQGPLARLRAATAQAHERLDSSIAVLERPWGVREHQRWLELTWGLLAPLERGLAAHAATDPGMLDVGQRARADLALADLAALGVGPERTGALRECPHVPVPRERAAALGVCYVLDGSTLGGRLIADAVVRAGVPAAATRSLTGREGAGRRWRETTAAVDAAGPQAVEAMAAAATATFTAYERWLAPLGTPAR
ncbi:hypothetical protein GTQ99_05210 [Kineococcus sp. T13]|uniref:biliverdin-producing heme oxygenase n=1 Tax=Kineococcus vitellinus TaxID=2696565 RepID=UPI001412BBEB|nr:biliverdin-producing heme oxygenase [Kineococcus vitellinus]NAZ74824.1 hypothetical protein [Kineococcus vitellinus]